MAETGTETREVRIAAVGDLHFGDDRAGTTRRQFAGISEEADILVLCGDLTTHGREDQIRALIEELSIVDIPIIAVLGNHDYESGKAELLQALLRESGVHVLDGDHVTIQGIGFAGTKGFAGGFGRGSLAPFGEQLIKDFVQGGIDEALKLENALRNLKTDRKVAVLHFAPIVGTVIGEPEIIYPFLGSSRLEQPLDMIGATVVFHGHAHHGSPAGRTPAGIPVFNVSLPLLAKDGRCYRVWKTSTAVADGDGRGPPGPGNGRA
jgi:Icc-related predicted phosphoesterase